MELYNIEQNFFGICTFSLLLLTTSIVFFQMAESKKDLPFIFSSLFSIGLVGISFIYTIMALYQYHERLERQISGSSATSIHRKEKLYWIFYLVLGILFLMIEVFVCFVFFGKMERLNFILLKKNKK